MIVFADVFSFFASAAIIIRALCQLNHMTWKTRIVIKIPYVCLAVAAAAIFIAPFYASDWRDSAYSFLTVAVALQLCIDRRFKNRTDLNP